MQPASPSSRLRPVVTALLSALIATVTGPALRAARAQADVPDPGAVVSSDGRTYPSVTLPLLESPPFRGTGVLPEGAAPGYAASRADLLPLAKGGIESVIGTDERHQVADTTQYPQRAIAFLEVHFPSGSGTCTGFFIYPYALATAGHCVYEADFGGWATSITVYPGRNGTSAPYGSASATALFTTGAWVASADHRYDYGVIKIASPLGNTTGWFGYGVKLDANLAKANARIFGYPGDKTYGTQWGTHRKIKGVGPEKIFYKIDTYGGQSGSPVYGRVSNTCQPCAFGIHAYGTGFEPYADSNSGTRVTDSVFANLAYWSSQ